MIEHPPCVASTLSNRTTYVLIPSGADPRRPLARTFHPTAHPIARAFRAHTNLFHRGRRAHLGLRADRNEPDHRKAVRRAPADVDQAWSESIGEQDEEGALP